MRPRAPFQLAFLCLVATVSGQERPPNVVVLFSDDAGYADFGFQPGCADDAKKLTPHLDRLAKEGARFTNAYMCASVCSPSRAGMMTGRYPQRFGYDNNLPPGFQSGLALTETFGAKRLRTLGYRTGLVGKWHLGYPPEYHPNERGWDRFYGLLQGSRPYFPMKPRRRNGRVNPNRIILDDKKPTPESGYVTDRFGDGACEFIKANKDRPFFLFVSFTTPHGPLQPKEEDLKRLEHVTAQRRRNYLGLVVSLDDNVGKILKCLDETKVADRTIVLFTNDNGGQTQLGANNGKLRGKKGMVLEGGLRVPWVMRWPGKIAPGSVVDDPVVSLDLLPTVVEVAGGKVDPEWKLDGVSLAGRLRGKQPALPARDLFWRQHGPKGPRAMRRGQWKLVHNRPAGTSPRLYDLAQDIGERTDLASARPEVLKAMVAALDAWEAPMKKPRWGPGDGKRPVRANRNYDR